MNVIHGEVLDVNGQLHSHDSIGYMNAEVQLTGNGWTSEFELRDFPDLKLPSAIRMLVKNGVDAIWVIGRIKAIFGSWIELEEGEKSILNAGFVAHLKNDGICVPFILHDYYLRTSFLFGETLDDIDIKKRIAYAFYEMLLSSPNELVDFHFRKYHIGASVTMVGGIEKGLVQYDEES